MRAGVSMSGRNVPAACADGDLPSIVGDYRDALIAALADTTRLREALDAIEEWRAAANVTQAEERIESLIAHCPPPVA